MVNKAQGSSILGIYVLSNLTNSVIFMKKGISANDKVRNIQLGGFWGTKSSIFLLDDEKINVKSKFKCKFKPRIKQKLLLVCEYHELNLSEFHLHSHTADIWSDETEAVPV